jgi:hypothetical protein
VHPHDLVGGRLVAGDAVAALGDQFLDQLGARGLVVARLSKTAAFRRVFQVVPT